MSSPHLLFGIAPVNSLDAFVGAWLVRRLGGEPFSLDRVGQVFLLLSVSTLCNALSACLGAAAVATVFPVPYWEAWRMWWSSSAVGVVVLMPLLLHSRQEQTPVLRSPARIGEALAVVVVLFIAFQLTFGANPTDHPFPSFAISLLLWPALRFGAVGVSLAIFLLAIVSVRNMAQGSGPFAHQEFSIPHRVVLSQLFLWVTALTFQILAIVLKQRQQATLALRDINARIADANTQLQAVLDAATEVSIIATDTKGVITTFNRGAERLLGWTASEMIGLQTPMRIHLADEVAAHAAALEKELGTQVSGFEAFVARARRGAHDQREWTYVRKDGSHLVVSLVVTAQRDGIGTIIGFLGVAVDVTERKRIENQLHQAKDVAEAASRAKSQFLATMSHEIRTPMNGVLGMTEVLLSTPLTPEQRDGLDTVKSSGKALLSIIDDILDFSKIEAGKVDLVAIPFSLREVIEETVCPLRLGAEQKGLAFTCSIADDIPDGLVGDAGRFRQILVNLLGNAIKFTQRGWVGLKVTSVAKDADGIELQIAVRDTGIGIPSEQLSVIFEPFVQADNSTTRLFGGTGLGLSISKRLVELMGGRIEVESKPNSGCVFRVTVRFGLCELQSQSHSPREQTHLRTLRILLAEDNVVNQKVARMLLENEGHQVTIANNGEIVLELLERESFDLILMDIQMPYLDGVLTTKAIRVEERSTGRHIPIVALTAHAMQGDAKRYQEAGMDGYITKPILRSELLAAIANVLPKAILTPVPQPHAQKVHRQEASQTNEEPPEPLAVFDESAFLMRIAGKVERLKDLLPLFHSECSRLMDELTTAASCEDVQGVFTTAHSMYGMLVNFGAPAAAKVARQLETQAQQGRLADTSELVRVLGVEIERLRDALTITMTKREITPQT